MSGRCGRRVGIRYHYLYWYLPLQYGEGYYACGE
jgi:hypothetical protein